MYQKEGDNMKKTETETQTPRKDTAIRVWENLQLFVLALTISGQVIIGASYLLGQGLWFVANVITIIRDFKLHRPAADKIKDISLTAITCGLIVVNLITIYG